MSFNKGGGSTSAMSTSGIDFDISSTENGILHHARSNILVVARIWTDRLFHDTKAMVGKDKNQTKISLCKTMEKFGVSVIPRVVIQQE